MSNTILMEIKIMASTAVMYKGKVLVLRRSAGEKFLSGYWTIVGGKYEDSDSSIENAVLREVEEETGQRGCVVRPLNIQEFTRDDKPGVRVLEITYLCEVVSEDVKLNPSEHDSFRWITAANIPEITPVTDLTTLKLQAIFKAL